MDLITRSIDFTTKRGRYPDFNDLADMGFTRAQIRTVSTTLGGLHDYLSEFCPVIDLKRHKLNNKISRGKKTYVLTSAVTGAAVHKGFYANIQRLLTEYDAELVIGPVLGDNKNTVTLDPALADHPIAMQDITFNSNVFALGLQSKARQVEPVARLKRLAQKEGTFITFSPKQRLKCAATGIGKLPVIMTSTGSITLPSYSAKNTILADPNTRLAEQDHVIGAVILEIDGQKFHFRHIQADSHGNFVDLNKHFTNGNVGTMRGHLICGDYHTGYTNAKVKKATFEMIKQLRPLSVVLHDAYDGYSTNPHTAGRQIALAKQATSGFLTLKDELDRFAVELAEFQATGSKTIIVKANHDEFLDRYLQASKYVKHPFNHEQAIELAAAMFDGEDPLVYAMKVRLKNLNNLVFLQRDESYMLAGYECGQHGDKGSNGAKGTVAGMENSYFKCVFGHHHTPEVLRGAICVGTSTDTNPHYGRGASSWLNTHAMIYPNGTWQLINIIGGEWRLER